MAHKLNEEEIRLRSAELSQHVGTIKEVKANKKALMRSHAETIRYHQELADRLAQEINSGEAEESEQAELPLEG